MSDSALSEPVFLLVVSGLILLAGVIKVAFERHLRIPAVVGYILLGALLRGAQQQWGLIAAEAEGTLTFLAHVGVFALLFHVGLRSDVKALARQLPRASFVWIFNVVFSAGAGYLAARMLGLALVPALFVAAALSATSIGVSVAIWDTAKLMKTRVAQLLVDVAELDDVSAILLMLAVVTAAPLLRSGDLLDAAGAASGAVGIMLVKVALFAAGCWLFARYGEAPLSRLLARTLPASDRLLTILAVGLAIAAIAGTIGFSIAVGALFAGLSFSRDAEAVRGESWIQPLYAFFTPFFFIDIGYALDPGSLAASLKLGAWLLVPAVLGKIVGGALPVWRSLGLQTGLLLGLSLVPRAEIALLVARTGNRLGDWAVSDELYGGIVVACTLASIASPFALAPLLSRWRQTLSPPPDDD